MHALHTVGNRYEYKLLLPDLEPLCMHSILPCRDGVVLDLN